MITHLDEDMESLASTRLRGATSASESDPSAPAAMRGESRRLLSIVTPCYNEAANLATLCEEIRRVAGGLAGWDYEHIVIDNASTDESVALLRARAALDPALKVIVNVRNFGHIRSPYYALLQARGDAVILMASDLQDPPELICEFVQKWESGFKMVLGVKNTSSESPLFFALRRAYYRVTNRLSSVKLYENATGFGLYDRAVIQALRSVDDPYPYFRGLIAELGFEATEVSFHQPTRQRGITKNNFYTLYDIGMLGITSHSKIPLRLAAMLGFALSIVSFFVAVGYFVAKLVNWSSFSLGTAPIVISIFFFASVQLFFTGILGEYIGAIHTQVLKRPLVVEKERINF